MFGPLKDLKVLYFGGIGPGPFAAMLLADFGADVIRVDPPAIEESGNSLIPEQKRHDVLARSQRSVLLDVKTEAGLDTALALTAKADILIEGFRPGVMEKLGLGPEKCTRINPKLIYGRITGWGQDGPLAMTAGHDINYIALSGALDTLRWEGQPPTPPLNLIGDYAGGGMFLVLGILGALYERERSGRGQTVDAAMTEGTALLMAQYFGWSAAGMLKANPGTNIVDGGPHFYSVYECADGKYVSIGAVEPKFYKALAEKLDLDPGQLRSQYSSNTWSDMRICFTEIFKQRSRDEWIEVFCDSDACITPVLSMQEAASHPQNTARMSFVEVDGVTQPAPGPRFSGTPTSPPRPPSSLGADSITALLDWGIAKTTINQLIDQHILIERPGAHNAHEGFSS